MSGSRRRSTSWASRTSAGRPRPGASGCKRKTISKRMRAKLAEVKDQLKRRRHQPIPEQGRWLASVVRGHLAYYAVPGNSDAIGGLPRPGDPALVQGASAPQPAHPPHLGPDAPPRASMAPARPHPAPLTRRALRRPHPRQEPSAVVPLAGICAGGRPQGRSLPRTPFGHRGRASCRSATGALRSSEPIGSGLRGRMRLKDAMPALPLVRGPFGWSG